ncbi:MAG: sulfatase-like hydrolase/transferase, partial [Pirellulaceae bacterium]
MFGRLAQVAIFLVALSARSLAEVNDRPPNFVIVFADDLGYGDLGCFGSTAIRTPHLDRMASEGMRFTSFYAQPVCGPSRTAIMTGSYPMRVAERGNVKNIHPIVHEKEITIAELLRPLGYATAMIGKWDLAKHTNRGFHIDLLPQGQGFDMHFGTPSSNDNWARTVLLRNGKVIEDPIRQEISTTERYVDAAIKFITSNQSRPFFIYLCPNMPHTALHASAAFRGKSKRGLYGDVVEEMDYHVGRILDTLRQNGLEEDTYVLFTSDNGPWLIKNQNHRQGIGVQDHGGSAALLRSGKVSTWEGGVRVPCVFWAPGRIPAGTVCDKLASTLDVLPTLAALAGTEKPNDRIIDGEEIRHLLAGQFDKAAQDKTFYYYFLKHLQAVRQGKWKLHLPRPERPRWLRPFSPNRHIHPSDDVAITHPLLFDLDADIGETEDVAGRHPDVVARLSAIAEAVRADIGDYNRVGNGARFFDSGTPRPDARLTNAPATPKSFVPIRLIFDTDIESDFDDVGTVAMLHALADNGEVEILAMGVSATSPLCAPCLDVLNTYYDRPDIPIGVLKGKGAKQWPSPYNETLVKEFPHDLQSLEQAPDAALLYRKVLASQPDQSVVMVTVGFVTNFKNLLKTSGDEHSKLDGRALVAKKVRAWVCMGGAIPEGPEHNLVQDASSAAYCF